MIIAGYGYAILQRNHTEAAIEEINRKARVLGLSYGQMVQKYRKNANALLTLAK